MKRILIMAGGTGGHIVPGLALAKRFREKGFEVSWLGTRAGLEADLVPPADIPLSFISISGLRGRGVLSLCFAPFRLFFALLQSLRVMLRVQPHLVLGMGGFVAGPGGLAAWLTRRPLVIHEQNAIAGFTNKLLSRFSARVLEAFPEAFGHAKNTILTGNPVRVDIASLPAPRERFEGRTGPLRLLVLGGSRGAMALNELLPEAIRAMLADARPEVWHQAGAKSVIQTKQKYASEGVPAKVEPFISDMAEAYAWADLVVCRSGASTVTELATAGVGSILIPFPHAVDDHQTKNADYLLNAGAAIVKQQRDLTPAILAELLQNMDREELLIMAEAAYSKRKPDATEFIVAQCLKLYETN